MSGHWDAELLREQREALVLRLCAAERTIERLTSERDHWRDRCYRVEHARLGGSDPEIARPGCRTARQGAVPATAS